MLNDSPLFLISSERSGTNLLRKLITQHQDVYFGPSPAHFLTVLYYREPYYGDMENDENFKNLINDALDLCYIHFSPWSIKLDTETVFEKYNNENFNKRNIVLLSHLLMTLYAREKGYKTYFCKDNNLYDFVFEILYNLPNSKFIYLHRDPRDFAVSQFERSLQSDSLVKISNMWAYEQVKCISVFSALDEKRVIKISYEEILDDSNKCITKICSFLNVNFLEKEKNVEVFTGKNEEWSNLNKPVMRNNSKKYLNKFNKNQLIIIESITYQQMNFLGYDLENTPKKISLVYKLFETLLGELKFRTRRLFIKNKTEHQANIKRAKLVNKLSVKWNRGL